MDSDGFEALQQALDRCDAVIHGMIERDAEEMLALRDAVRQLAGALGGGFTAKLTLTMSLVDRRGGRELPWEVAAFASDSGGQTYDATDDCSPQRYEVNSCTSVVPRDRCPRCWQSWPRKSEQPKCSHCGLALGQDCTIILEHGACPQCEDGSVSDDAPVCTECGYRVVHQHVAWR